MLTVFISSDSCNNDNNIPTFNFACNITPFFSTVTDDKGLYVRQPGFKLEFRDTSNSEFKDKIWPYLMQKYDLTCAFIIKEHEYMGCIRNWPNVFTSSQCPGKCQEM